MSDVVEGKDLWVDVGASGDVPDGEVKAMVVEGHRVAVARANAKLYAVQDLCSHDDGPLGEGELEGHSVVCPRHGARFDVRTGAVVLMPAIAPIKTYAVKEQDGRIHVAVPADSAGGTDESW